MTKSPYRNQPSRRFGPPRFARLEGPGLHRLLAVFTAEPLPGGVLEILMGRPIDPGRLNYTAIQTSDFPVTQGTVLLAAAFIILANIVVDIAYAYLDPRVRYS